MFAFSALMPALAIAAINSPPGATEGDQYFEEVPNGAGSSGPNHGGGGGGGGASAGQPVKATQALDQLGADGQAAAALANANRPPEQGKGQPQGKKQPPAPSQTSSPTDGDGGMGIWFPLLLGLTALAAGAYGIRRRLQPT
jgi:hypothetical protein